MVKVFTIKGYQFREVSKCRGAIEYHLVDEFGIKRTVTAAAKIGWNNKISSIKPVFKRETPLVEALASREVNDKVVVDFSGFNKKYPRVMKNRTKAINGDFTKSVGNRSIHSLADINKFRLFQLFLVSVVCLSIFIFSKSLIA